MTIALIISIPIIVAIVGFLVLKSVQLGLRWQVEVRQERTPTLDKVNPLEPFQQAKEEKEAKSLLNEWVHGEEQ